MARPKAEPGAGRDRGKIGQRAARETECLDRAGVLRPVRLGVIAAGHQQHRVVRRRGQDLMRIDAVIEFFRLRDRRADRAVGIEAMHGDVARIVVGREQILAAGIDAAVYRPRRQCRWRAVYPQCACGLIDRQRVGAMRIARDLRPAIARHHVESAPRRMWPGILDIRRQCHRAAFEQRGIIDVDVVERELGTDTGVIHRLGFAAAHVPPDRAGLGRVFYEPRVLADEGAVAQLGERLL